ncbi:MAG: hypothetical protein ACRD2E_02035 [Terriglobales bacterium]
MKPRRRWVSPLDWIGNRIYVPVKPPRYCPKPPGAVRAWFMRGPGRRGQSYREMVLIAVATFSALVGGLFLIQLLTGHLPGGGTPISVEKGAAGFGLFVAALGLSPRRRATIVAIPALLLALSFWAAVLHPSEPRFWDICAGCVLAIGVLIKLWGWNLDQ